MDCNIEFVVNSRMEIEMEDGFYKSNIQDVGEDTIGISIPVNKGKYLPLKKGDNIKCIYFYKNQMYSFNTVAVSRKIDRVLIIEIKKPEDVRFYQRRNFVRVPLVVDILCANVPMVKDVRHLDDQIDFFNATLLNISGGGMKVSIDVSLESKLSYGRVLMLTIPAGDENITVKGRLVRIDRDINKRKIICGVSFVELDERNREKIISLVFKIMREQIKKRTKGD
ncbi:flagellar brake protein [Clostridium sp. LBM24168]